MKARRCHLWPVIPAVLFTLVLPHSRLLGQCDGALRLSNVLPSTPAPLGIRFETRPDLSNPGARALAIGGAFSATADDATAVIANPAGIASLVNRSIQVEARYNPIVQVDAYNEGLTPVPGVITGDVYYGSKETGGFPPAFASIVLPVGDTFALGVFGQLNYNVDRTVNRVGTGSAAERAKGPCFNTVDPRGQSIAVYTPLYNLVDETQIFRFGVTVARRFSEKFALGITVYGTSETKKQNYTGGDAVGFDPQPAIPVETSSVKPGIIGGVYSTLSEKFRVGLVAASQVVYGNENEKDGDANAPRGTVLPYRVGLGLTYAPAPKWTLAADVVRVGYSNLLGSIDWDKAILGPYPKEARDKGNWDIPDAWEIRFGAEFIPLETRTKLLTLRGGFFTETASNLRFQYATSVAANQAAIDLLRALFPDENLPQQMHATWGVGYLANRQWQIDAGFDYEFKQKKLVASMLLGYYF